MLFLSPDICMTSLFIYSQGKLNSSLHIKSGSHDWHKYKNDDCNWERNLQRFWQNEKRKCPELFCWMFMAGAYLSSTSYIATPLTPSNSNSSPSFLLEIWGLRCIYGTKTSQDPLPLSVIHPQMAAHVSSLDLRNSYVRTIPLFRILAYLLHKW